MNNMMQSSINSKSKNKKKRGGNKNKETKTTVQKNNNDHFTSHAARTKTIKEDMSSAVQGIKQLNLTDDSKDASVEIDTKNCNINKITHYLAIDCEMVGIRVNGRRDMLARVSIVNKFGNCVYDKFVRAEEEVTDYRTYVSGVREEDLLNGEEFTTIRKEVAKMLKGRILVGHSVKNDLRVLSLCHPHKNIRDTSMYRSFRRVSEGRTPSLKCLAKELLGMDIQTGEHDSVEDARAAMQLYCSVAKQWEVDIKDPHYDSTSLLFEEYY